MKYIKTFESHRSSKNDSLQPVNEEIFGAIGKLLGNLFKKAKERINKTKGGADVESIYQKYMKMIGEEFSKTAKVALNIAAADEIGEGKPPVKKPADAPAADAPDAPATDTSSTDVDAKTAVTQLKAKKGVLDQIVAKLKEVALKEMGAVLKKYGGAAANPQLDMIITSKKDQFELDYMNSQISYLEAAGDKVESVNIGKQRDVVMKKIEAGFKDFDTKKAVTYKEGDEVIYLLKDKKKEEWDKLTDDEKKNPTEGNASKIVSTNKISKIDGDKFTLLDKDGKPTIDKTSAEIIGLSTPEEGAEEKVEYKENDEVIYLLKDKTKEEWDKLTPEEKEKANEEPALSIVGINKISKIDGDNFKLLDKDGKPTIDKTSAEIIGLKPADMASSTTEYKVGDVVIFKRNTEPDLTFDKKDGQKQWDVIKEEDRNPENEAVKKMIDDGLINSNTIDKVEGDILTFKKKDGTTYTKNKEDVLSLVKPK